MLKCGFYETEITPPLGSSIYGYFFPRHVEGVKDKLFVKAVAVESGDECFAIACVDIVSLPADGFYHKVTERVNALCPELSKKNIMISATHSHTSGPREVGCELDELYINMLTIQVADCIVLAAQRLSDTVAYFAEGKAEGLAFIRNYVMADGTVRTNPGFKLPDIIEPYGNFDAAFPALFFKDKAGKRNGVIVNFACHHDCVHGSFVSGDYSSVLSKELKKLYGADFVTVFLNAPCANINNWDCIGKASEPPSEDYIRIGKELASLAQRLEKSALPLDDTIIKTNSGTLILKRRQLDQSILSEAEVLLATKQGEEEGNIVEDPEGLAFKTATAGELLKVYRDGADEYVCTIHTFRLGGCMFASIPSEIFSQFGDMIKEKVSADKVFIAELSNDGEADAYVPVRELLEYSTVYETAPVSRRYEEDAGYKIVDKVSELAKKIF